MFAVEVARHIGQKLNAVAGQSGTSWYARMADQFLTLRSLDFLLGRGWEEEMQVNRLGHPVKVFVHDRLLSAVEAKYNAATQASHLLCAFKALLAPC
jgi:hypothetical protein